MTDEQDKRYVTISIPPVLAEFIGSVWAKALAILTAASIVLGIILELQAVVAGVYGIRKAAAEAQISEVNAFYAKEMGKYP
jgi:hypothetical protein